VSGFDEALGGGIPEGSVVVVAGSPGTMKSSLALSILLNHARAGTRGLYVTLDEGGHSLLRQAVALGLDTTAIPHDVRLLDFGPQGPDRDWLASFRTQVEAVHADRGDRLLVLDSLEGLEARAGLVDRRRDLFKLFDWMRSLGTTTFLLAERPDVFVRNAVVFGRYDEDYLADGILHLRLHVGEDATVQRRLRCVKLRRAAHDPSYFALLFDGGRFHATKSLRGS
jgi:circadian clock protein KaiC